MIDSSELYADFLATLERAARHLGLPPHDFYYDSKFQHSTGACKKDRPQYFGEDGRWEIDRPHRCAFGGVWSE